ncbi:MAG: hypothetical protein IKN81_00080 [Oscillospiraceae bacterium]|nr:hypothetical protein [Oscillospiraceae bacterium]
MSDGSIRIDTKIDTRGAERDLAQLEKALKATQRQAAAQAAKVSELEAKYADMTASVKAINDAVGGAPLDKSALFAAVPEAAKTNAELTAARENLAELRGEESRLNGQLEITRRTVDALHETAPPTAEEATENLDRAAKSLDRFTNRIIGLAKRVFVFTLITKALRGLRSYLWEGITANDEAAASVARLRGALLTLAQPILQVVIPAFTALVNILTRVVTAVASVISALFGKTLEQSAEAAKGLYNEQKALKGVGSAAKSASKSLAAFDEINQLGDDSSGGIAGGGAGGIDATAPDFSAMISGQLGEIEAIIGGALLAVGAVLAFSGISVPVGLALMAVGAVTLAATAKENWDNIRQKLEGPLGAITTVVSGALLGLGAILAFSGANIPLGIALMATGAVGLVTTAAVNWDTIKGFIEDNATEITTIVRGAVLAVGAILAFSGVNVPLGLAMVAVGAAGLAEAAVENWDSVKQSLQGSLGAVTTVVSAALLALGAVLTFSGANIPVGLGLLAVGAVGLATTLAANWDTISQKLNGPLGGVTALVSAALLALGAVLTFSGANLVLGIGLMAAGAAGLVTTAAVNWDVIQQKIRPVLAGIGAILSGSLAVLGVLLCLSGAGIGLGLALLFAGLIGSYAAWKLDDNPITRFVKNMANSIIAIVNKVIDAVNSLFHIRFSGLNIGGAQIIPAFDTRLVKLPRIPALAEGAVIPANREFLAVLGDQTSGRNIEAPEALLRQMAREAASANTELLQAILAAIREGHVIEVDHVKLGETARKAIRDVERMGAHW